MSVCSVFYYRFSSNEETTEVHITKHIYDRCQHSTGGHLEILYCFLFLGNMLMLSLISPSHLLP